MGYFVSFSLEEKKEVVFDRRLGLGIILVLPFPEISIEGQIIPSSPFFPFDFGRGLSGRHTGIAYCCSTALCVAKKAVFSFTLECVTIRFQVQVLNGVVLIS